MLFRGDRSTKAPKAKLLKTFSLIAVIFLTVSGGPYGLEPLMQYAGMNGALLLLCLVPLLWDIPTIFAVLELNSMMPEEGGYYKWVSRALGRRWASYEGWWSWLYSFADLAIYPVLFTTYLSYFFPWASAYKIPVCLAVIWGSALLNLIGIVQVGRTSRFLAAIILIPFIILFVKALFINHLPCSFPPPRLQDMGFSSLGMGIYIVMWNFIGWDNVTTYACEVNKPVKSYITSILVAFALIAAVYFATIFITVNSMVDFGKLNASGFPYLGARIGGPWLGAIIAVGGMAMALGVFSAVMLSISRVPKAMADDRLMPNFLGKIHPTFNTPYLTIILCASVVSFLVLFTLPELIVIDLILYGAGLFLEFISLIALRIKEPDAPRPFRIPLNTFFLTLLLLIPVMIFCVALSGVLSNPGSNGVILWLGFAALLSAEPAWRLLGRRTEK